MEEAVALQGGKGRCLAAKVITRNTGQRQYKQQQ